MRAVCRGDETPALAGFVRAVVARKPAHCAVVLESQQVRRHAVEKPAVVRENQSRSGTPFEGIPGNSAQPLPCRAPYEGGVQKPP